MLLRNTRSKLGREREKKLKCTWADVFRLRVRIALFVQDFRSTTVTSQPGVKYILHLLPRRT